MSAPPDPRQAFRAALGAFATGVTIATTRDGAGDPVGVTASSFNSVSLDPPLVLWSLSRASLSRAAFEASGHFAVHVLAASQQALSDAFARSGADKFAAVEWSEGLLGSPILSRYAALFQCRTRHQYDGGDHVIIVGEVVGFDARDEPPLLFHHGRYAERRPRQAIGEPIADASLSRLLERAWTAARTRADALGGEAASEAELAALLTPAELVEAKYLLDRIARATDS